MLVGDCSGNLGNKWGYVDKAGKLAIAPQSDVADPVSDGRAMVGLGPKLGYIDKTGKFAINPQYDGAGQFGDGRAPVVVSGVGEEGHRKG